MYIMKKQWKKRMTDKKITNLQWLICSFFLLFSSLLSSCYKDQNSNEIANGMGGTGITHSRITNLGLDGLNDTMTVQGIQFSTQNAKFTRDGVPTQEQSDFNLGEIVTVFGTTNENGTSGVASEVIFENILEGSVTMIVNGNTIEVLGQPVETDSQTIFHGFDQLIDLKIGYIIEVSGFINAQQQILATSLRLLQTTFTANSSILDVEGHISNVDKLEQTLNINNLIVDYSGAQIDNFDAEGFTNGLYLIVRSTLPLNNDVLTATRIVVLSAQLEPNSYQELEGFISRFNSVTDFDLDGNSVVSNINTRYLNGSKSDIGLNKHIIVRGITNNDGVLFADEITLIDITSQIFLETDIETIDRINNTISVLGINIAIEPITYITNEGESNIQINFNDFVEGDYVFVEAYRNIDNKYIALQLSKTPFLTTIRIISTVENIDGQQGIVTFFNHTIETDSATEYYDVFSDPISKEIFFSQLKKGKSLVDVIGIQIDTTSVLASAIFIDADGK